MGNQSSSPEERQRMTRDIEVRREGDVEVITIDRPEVRNALRFETYDQLEQAVRESEARCLVITGVDPAFCSGDDVRAVMGGGAREKPLVVAPRLTPAADAILHSNIPIVAAVNGAAVGWGMELALMADLRVASELARFGELFVKRGLCCDVAGLGRLVQLVGRERASELLFTGRIIDAQEALELGLVSRVVAHYELMPAAMEIARAIAANPPLAVRALKRGLRRALDPDWEDLGIWVSSTLNDLFATEDHREGVAAFLEKRDASYVGR
jgi:enoyl-CoA hydratase